MKFHAIAMLWLPLGDSAGGLLSPEAASGLLPGHLGAAGLSRQSSEMLSLTSHHPDMPPPGGPVPVLHVPGAGVQAGHGELPP